MKKITNTFLFLLCFFAQLSAQNINGLITPKKPLLFEKLYLHVDRELYLPGDKIWLKAYQVNGITHQLNSNFRNIFVQLIAEDGRIVKDLMLFSMNGQANGEFKTDSLANGMYTIRAFTKYLQNFGEEACFHKRIWIFKPQKSVDPAEKVQPDDSIIDVSFLPEGGNLVLNAVNTIAFKAIDSKGKGISVTGQIRNENGDTITSFATSYKGMGKFILMPEDGVKYYATIDRYPELKIPLPSAKTNGISLNYKEKDELLLFEVSANMKLSHSPVFYFVASHKGDVLIEKKIEMTNFSETLSLRKDLFSNGISKITLLDTTKSPLAECLIFVDDHKGDLLHLRLNQKEFKPREEVKIDVEALLEPGDSIASTLSVAVVNKNDLVAGENNQNIKSYLLLDSDLKGAIESPSDYFMDDKFHTSAEKLDLLMLVHGWRTYLWDDVEQTPTPSLDDWNDAGITVSGYVKKLLWKAPVPEAAISIDYAFKKFKIAKTTTDKNGRFLFKHVYLADALKVMINARTKDGSRNAEIILDPSPKKDSIVSLSQLKSCCFDPELDLNFMHGNSSRRNKESGFNPEEGTILLEGVDIVQEKGNTMIRSSGAYPWADKMLTISKNDYSYFNILDYLAEKVPGLTVIGDDITKGTKHFDFMVGAEEYYSIQEVKTIRMKDIETIDVVYPGFRKGFATSSLGETNANGLIAIYMKSGDWSIPLDAEYVKGRIFPKLRGFRDPVQFYSPKYTPENLLSLKPDFRHTLYWNPNVSFENGKASLDFFTSDEPAKYAVYREGISKNLITVSQNKLSKMEYVVYLEGITKKGKICYGTTSFTVNNK